MAFHNKFNKPLFETKKHDMDNLSDEDILMDVNLNSEQDEDLGINKKSKQSKNSKNNFNFQTLREMRNKKFKDKDSNLNILSQDQLDFVKKIAENNTKIENNIYTENQNQVSINKFKSLEYQANDEFSIIKNSIYPWQNIMINLIEGLISSKIQILGCDESSLSLKIQMEKNSREGIKFILNYNRALEPNYVEYIPIDVTFKFINEETAFYEELEIRLEDLGKFIRRLLNHKFSN